MLWVSHDPETDEYEWVIAQRPKNTEDDWTGIVAGHVDGMKDRLLNDERTDLAAISEISDPPHRVRERVHVPV